MDTQAQLQAIVERLVGFSPPLPLADFDEPWRTIYARLKHASSRDKAEAILVEAARDLPGGSDLLPPILALLPSGSAFRILPPLGVLGAGLPPVDWLWPSWIPRRLITLLGAAPGAGKSLVALDLARRLIAGEPFPDGAPVPCPGSDVLIFDAERTPSLLNQRAVAWGIDLRRLFVLPGPGAEATPDLSSRITQGVLLYIVRELQPSLIVVDSLGAATSQGETSLKGARAILDFLSTLACEGNAALLAIHHLRKRANSGPLASARPLAADDLRGSSHLSAAARSVLALSLTNPALGEAGALDLNGPRRLEVIKTNLCPYPPPLGLMFEQGEAGAPLLRYTGPIQTLPQPASLGPCARWLLDYLASAQAPVRPTDVVRDARDAGFSRPTLYRTRAALGARITELGSGAHDPDKHWTLPTSPPDD